MNKREKEVIQAQLDAEKAVLEKMEQQYKRALSDINQKVKLFDADIKSLDTLLNMDSMDEAQKATLESMKQAKIYQKQYQQALKKQIGSILDKLHGDTFSTVDQYLKECYQDGFLGTMYDIHAQGIPIIVPINQEAVAKAVVLDSKVVKGYYEALGVDFDRLKKVIPAEVSRGIASSLPYVDIARNINNASRSGLYNAVRIARTEGHRIQQASTYDAQKAAKAKGADVVKQWDATLDGRTRDTHRLLDGQIREVDEPFEVRGMTAMMPGDFGRPEEDIHCRCVSLTRAKWALDDSELQTLQERAEYFGLDKATDFEDFKQKYLNLPEDADKRDVRALEKPVESKDEHYRKCIDIFKNAGVEYNPVKSHTRKLTQEEIIKELAGADKTTGSCASVAMTYIGQKLGLNVRDFRGGKSMESFRDWNNLESLVQMEGMKVFRAKGASSLTVGNRLLKKVEQGKEYYLCVGRHASIVRKTEEGVLQYLELQADYSETARYGAGWHDFTSNPKRILNWRFGCNSTSNHWHEKLDFMIDIDGSELNTDEIKSILGYINTDVGKEVKGAGGMLK